MVPPRLRGNPLSHLPRGGLSVLVVYQSLDTVKMQHSLPEVDVEGRSRGELLEMAFGCTSPSPSPLGSDSEVAADEGAEQEDSAGCQGAAEPHIAKTLHHRHVRGLHQVGIMSCLPAPSRRVAASTLYRSPTQQQQQQRALKTNRTFHTAQRRASLSHHPAAWLCVGLSSDAFRRCAQVKGWLSGADQGAVLHFAEHAGWLVDPGKHNQAGPCPGSIDRLS